jgi:hypothetical protein
MHVNIVPAMERNRHSKNQNRETEKTKKRRRFSLAALA